MTGECGDAGLQWCDFSPTTLVVQAAKYHDALVRAASIRWTDGGSTIKY